MKKYLWMLSAAVVIGALRVKVKDILQNQGAVLLDCYNDLMKN